MVILLCQKEWFTSSSMHFAVIIKAQMTPYAWYIWMRSQLKVNNIHDFVICQLKIHKIYKMISL